MNHVTVYGNFMTKVWIKVNPPLRFSWIKGHMIHLLQTGCDKQYNSCVDFTEFSGTWHFLIRVPMGNSWLQPASLNKLQVSLSSTIVNALQFSSVKTVTSQLCPLLCCLMIQHFRWSTKYGVSSNQFVPVIQCRPTYVFINRLIHFLCGRNVTAVFYRQSITKIMK